MYFKTSPSACTGSFHSKRMGVQQVLVLTYDRDYLLRLIISITLELVLTLRMIIFYCRLIIIYIILFEKFKTTQTVFFLKFISDGISVVILSSLYESTFESCFYSIIRALSRAIKPDYTYDIVVSIMKV
jgi:hypothetical protein